MDENRYIKRKEKARNDGNRDQLAISCKHLGDFYNEQGKFQYAVQQYEEEAELYARMGKQLEMAKAHRMIGEMYMLLCEFDNAKKHINVYLKAVKKLQNKVEEQRAYATSGRAHLLHGQNLGETSASGALEQLKLAEKCFLRSLLLIKEISGQISKLEQLDMQARCYLNIGVVKEHMEDFEESIAYIEKAIKICVNHDLFELTHLCYISMSLLYNFKKNETTLALRYCNLALQVAKRLPNKVKKICETLLTKSEILIKVGDFASVKQILTKAYKKNTPDENDRNTIEKTLRIVVKICQTLDELVTTSSLDYAKRKGLYEKLGDGCCHLCNYEKAIEFYLKMLECARQNSDVGKTLIPIYVSLYQTYKDNKQYDRALEYLWKEYELNKEVPKEAFTTLCSIAEVCELQKQPFWTIQDIYQQARVQANKALGQETQIKLEKIAMTRLKRLQLKQGMDMLAEELTAEAKNKGITLDDIDDDDDEDASENGSDECAQNTPELGDDVCLDDLTDSDTSDLDETDKVRLHRATRGTRTLTIKRNNKGETQLHQACIAGNLELARRLIEQGHAVNVRDHAGWLPLHEACNHGYRDIVQLLLEKGATSAINDKGGTSCDGITPLYDACSNGFLDVVELLLERGADVTVKTDYGETCISGLDKWRTSAKLNEGEQARYVSVRDMLQQTLSKVGISSSKNAKPLTNANVAVTSQLEEAEEQCDNSEELDDEDLYTRPRRSSEINRSVDSGKILRDKSSNSRQLNASSEYKNVMAQLKHPNRATSNIYDEDDIPSTSSAAALAAKHNKRTAFLDDEEVDADAWLIDDIGPEKKKRRYNNTTTGSRVSNMSTLTTTTSTSTRRCSNSKENLDDSAYSGWDKYCSDLFTPETTDAFEVLFEASTGSSSKREQQKRKLRLSRSSSISSSSNSATTTGNRTKPKQQISLLDSGFCRFRSESPVCDDESNDASSSILNNRSVEPDSTTTTAAATSIQLLISPSKNGTPLKMQAAPIVPTTVAFKIKVQDELLLVPIERKKLQDINIRWLAEEAARRYYNLVGLKPVLRLKTVDGFAYEENDPVDVAIEQNMILASVLEYKTSPLAQRYEEMCQQLNKDINNEIKAVLVRAQSTNSIEFVDQWLTPDITEPLFKALLHQTRLTILDLCNNFIQNEGCKQLSKSLPTLTQLKTLNLKGNFITSDGLDALLNCVGIDKLEQLEELNLSRNPLGNSCLRSLDKFCNSNKSLRSLALAQCDLTNLSDYDLCYYQLTSFDISYNQLNDESIRLVLSKLNACRLQYLNISFIKLPSTVNARNCYALGDYIATLFESGTCEKFTKIELCGCGLIDIHLNRIVQSLVKSNDLEMLDISENNKLTGVAFQYIIEELPQLRKVLATNCVHLIDDERLVKLAQLQQLPNFMSLTISDDAVEDDTMISVSQHTAGHVDQLRSIWQRCWGDKGKIIASEGQLSLYVNEKDLYAP